MAHALLSVQLIAACSPPHYTASTIIRYRDVNAVQVTTPESASARVVDTDQSEAEFSVEPIRMSSGAPGLKWKTAAALSGGDETPLQFHTEKSCDESDATDECSEQAPTPAPGASVELLDDDAAALESLVTPQLGGPDLTLPGCADLGTYYVGYHMHSHRGAGFSTNITIPGLEPHGVALQVATPWSNVVEISTSHLAHRKQARATMWRAIFGGTAFLLLGGGGIAAGLELGGSNVELIGFSALVALLGIGLLGGAASEYSTSRATEYTTVIYPPGPR